MGGHWKEKLRCSESLKMESLSEDKGGSKSSE